MSALEALRQQIRKLETSHAKVKGTLPFGVEALDQHLPGGGLRLGALHEVSSTGSTGCSASAALFAAGILARLKGPVLWCVKHQDLFAPALCQVGLHPDRVIFVEARDETGVLACFEEGLRHEGIAGVVGESKQIDNDCLKEAAIGSRKQWGGRIRSVAMAKAR